MSRQLETKTRIILGGCILLFIIVCGSLGGYYFLIAVSPGQFDYDYDVGNGSYTLHRSNAHSITITPKEGYTKETEIIPEKVVEIAWNNQYVIAKQYGMKRAYPDNPNNIYKIPDESIVNYWILDTENKERYGPYTYEEFLIKLQEFNIIDLELKPVRSYVEE